ncbi:SEL1-like repeat protein [Pseudoduganella armeniaca]|uniref:Sel1 repeat family protein n=1 Tax=Pseudoduganella armeniaca TaxID=2072590 RepID=A0A2R4CGZ8_9BURK|nr:SEL1-like repeat protein [Pseudoduganella armeniaca]AVR98866.1 hypothetical protein C9I28_27050 [Pseudoduganella armeniaca]
MANREELVLIRGARSGDAACQLALGRLYLRGSASLPLSLPTALHWLERAARQGLDEARLLIGRVAPQGEAGQLSPAPAYDGAGPASPALPAAAGQLPPATTGHVAPAPAAGAASAQLALGLQLAGMDREGNRVAGAVVQFKRAIRWLTQAGQQGQAEAWFALARIYTNGACSQRSAAEAQDCLERAAQLGHALAQLECGMHAWRQRRDDEGQDVRAVYWLQRAAAQGCPQAQQALDRIAPPPAGVGWAAELAARLTGEQLARQPLLAARIELAALFHLSRAEALLLDVLAADQGHCLVVDIRLAYKRSRRRLVLVRTARQRQALDRAVHLFEGHGAAMEGNYRQRLYRLKTWLGRCDASPGKESAVAASVSNVRFPAAVVASSATA